MRSKFKTLILIATISVLSSIPISTVKAAQGDFYNLTKHTKYTRANILSDDSLVEQLEYEMYEEKDIIAKEIAGNKVINYGLARDKFADLFLVQHKTALEAVFSLMKDSSINIDRQAQGIDNYDEARADFDVLSID